MITAKDDKDTKVKKETEETNIPQPGEVESGVTKYPSEVEAFGEVVRGSGVVQE